MSEAELSTLTHAELITKVLSLQKYIRRLTNYVDDLESRYNFQSALDHYKTLRQHSRRTQERVTAHDSTFALANSRSSSSSSPSSSPLLHPTTMYPSTSTAAVQPIPGVPFQGHTGSSSLSPPFPPMPALSEEYSPTHPQKSPNLQPRRMRTSKHLRRLSAVKTTNSRSVTPRFAPENDARFSRLSTVYVNPDVTSRNAHLSPSLQQPQQQQRMESQQATQDLNGLLVTMRIKVVPPPKQPPPSPPAETPKLEDEKVDSAVNSDDDDDGVDSDASMRSSDTEISIPMSPTQVVRPPVFSDGPTPLEMNTDSENSDVSDTDIDAVSDDDDDEKDEKIGSMKMMSDSGNNSPSINISDIDSDNNNDDNNDDGKSKKKKKSKKNKKKKDKKDKQKKKGKDNQKKKYEEDGDNNNDNNINDSQSEGEGDDENKGAKKGKKKYPFGFAAVAIARTDSDGDNAAGLAQSAPMKSPRGKESASSSKLPYSGSLWQQQQQNTFQQNRHHYHTITTNAKPINKMLPRHSSKGSFSGSTSSLAEGTPPSRGERLSLLIPPQHALRIMNNGGFSTPQKIVTPSKQLKMKSFIHDDLFSNPMAQTVFVPFQDELISYEDFDERHVNLTVLIVGAHNLRPKNIGDTLNAYAVLRVNKLLEKTQTSYRTLSPTWDEQFAFKFVDSNDVLTVEVYSTSRWKAETYLGTALVPLYNFKDLCVRELRCPLESLGRKHSGAPVSGDVHLIIQCTKMGVPLPDLSVACRSNARDLHPLVHFGSGQLALEVLSYEETAPDDDYGGDGGEDRSQQQNMQRSLCFRITVDGSQEAKSEISEPQKVTERRCKRKHKKKKAKIERKNVITWTKELKLNNTNNNEELNNNNNKKRKNIDSYDIDDDDDDDDGDDEVIVEEEVMGNEEEGGDDDPYKNIDNSFYFDVSSTSTIEITFYEAFSAPLPQQQQQQQQPITTSVASSSLATVMTTGTSSGASTPTIPTTTTTTVPSTPGAGASGAKLGWTVLGKATIAVSSIPVTFLTATELELPLALPSPSPTSTITAATTTSAASASSSSTPAILTTSNSSAANSTAATTTLGVVRVKALYLPPFRVPGAHALHSLFFGCFTPQFNWAYGSQTKETWSDEHEHEHDSLYPSSFRNNNNNNNNSDIGRYKLVRTDGLEKQPHVEDSRASVTAFWDEDTLADAFSSQENMRFYYHFVYDSPHTVYVGSSEGTGPVVLVVAAPDSGGFRKVLLWTQAGERRLVALGPADCVEKVRAECPQALAGVKLREARGCPELRNALRDYEASNTPSRFKVGVLYAGPGQRTEAELMGNTRVSHLFERFLEVLGERVELCGWPHYDGGLDTSESCADGTYSRYTTFQGIEVMYHVPSYMPFKRNDPQQIGRKRHVMNDTVVVVFKERGRKKKKKGNGNNNYDVDDDDVVDIASFQSHCTCVYFVVSPVIVGGNNNNGGGGKKKHHKGKKSVGRRNEMDNIEKEEEEEEEEDGELFYAVNVVYKDDILPAPPFLPRGGGGGGMDDDDDEFGHLLRHDKGLHAWIVKKIVNADKNTKISSVYSSMNEKSRRIVLSKIVENTQLK